MELANLITEAETLERKAQAVPRRIEAAERAVAEVKPLPSLGYEIPEGIPESYEQHARLMMDMLTRIGWEARVTDYRRGKTEEQLRQAGDDPTDKPVPMDAAAKEVVDYMLFVDEAPLPNAINGSTAFAERFAAYDTKANRRALRDLLERVSDP